MSCGYELACSLQVYFHEPNLVKGRSSRSMASGRFLCYIQAGFYLCPTPARCSQPSSEMSAPDDCERVRVVEAQTRTEDKCLAHLKTSAAASLMSTAEGSEDSFAVFTAAFMASLCTARLLLSEPPSPETAFAIKFKAADLTAESMLLQQ